MPDLGIITKILDNTAKVAKAAKAGHMSALAKAAFAIRKTAIDSIQRTPGPSATGEPPHTHTGQLPRAILYAVEKETEIAVIGPRASLMAQAASPHEFGGHYKRETFPARPFMGPALTENLDKLPAFWAGCVQAN